MTTTPRPVLTLRRRKPRARPAPKLVQVPRRKPSPGHQDHPGNDVDLLAALQTANPDLWDPRAPRPLAVGIHKQLYPIAERVRGSRSLVRRFLLRWTSSVAYQKALLEPGARRYNLDGSTAGEVSDEHRAAARERVGG